MHVTSLRLRNIAGHDALAWDRMQSDVNLLIGRNGVGKSTLLQALLIGLRYIAGTRFEGLITKTYPDGEVEIDLREGSETLTRAYSFQEILRSQGNRPREFDLRALQFVENRQPKSRLGDGRSDARAHPLVRYPHAVSEIRGLLLSDAPAERHLAAEVLDLCKSMPASGSESEWDWIWEAVREHPETNARPVSCGQFDLVAVMLDLLRLRNDLAGIEASAFIFLDNPETYLHPACQEFVMSTIREQVPKAQVFVASHSLKLLCHRESRSVYWLTREAAPEAGQTRVVSVRELEEGMKGAFFELYGDDVSSAVLHLLHSFDSPEYYRFLCECALPPQAERRPDPAADRQISAVVRSADPGRHGWTVLDFGAGHGDLLVGLASASRVPQDVRYIALTTDRPPSSYLVARLEQAREKHLVTAGSAVIGDLREAPPDCDRIVLLNVCHEILLPELPALLSELLASHLRRDPGGSLIIHEVETLTAGEASFVMWTPDDYRAVFAGIPGVAVGETGPSGPGVPLHTTIISRCSGQDPPGDLGSRMQAAFARLLPGKRERRLDEIEALSRVASEGPKLAVHLRQRRLAFALAELATIMLLERRPTQPSAGRIS